jgi:hypothetical protein
MVFITYDQAVQHLRIGTEDEDDVRLKIEQAEAIVLTYLASSTTGSWTEEQACLIQAAVLMQLAELYRFRGDDPSTDWREAMNTGNYLTPAIRRVLYPLRKSVVA